MRIVHTREERLWGLQIRTTTGLATFEPLEDEGGTGVREPRRPKPGPPNATAEAKVERVEATG